MKIVLVIIGTISIAFGLYMVYKGDTFIDQIFLFVNGVVLFGCAFIDFDKNKCQTSKQENR